MEWALKHSYRAEAGDDHRNLKATEEAVPSRYVPSRVLGLRDEEAVNRRTRKHEENSVRRCKNGLDRHVCRETNLCDN